MSSGAPTLGYSPTYEKPVHRCRVKYLVVWMAAAPEPNKASSEVAKDGARINVAAPDWSIEASWPVFRVRSLALAKTVGRDLCHKTQRHGDNKVTAGIMG